ncbi:MAG: hypothetical protein LBU67_01985 [Oscillospiraceae bacterium]|nr:hypothetical protein [Oscillospiraceae bacterium]
MDAGLFWSDTMAYFRTGNYGYMLMLSTELGLLWLLLPVCSILPLAAAGLSESADAGKARWLGRLRPRWVFKQLVGSLVPLVFVFLLYGVFLSLVCPAGSESSWQLVAMEHAYAWRAADAWMPLFTAECLFRLVISASTWAMTGLALYRVFRHKATVAALVFALTLWMEYVGRYVGGGWSSSFLQVPGVSNTIPLSHLLYRQMLYLCVAIALYALLCGAETALEGRRKNRRARVCQTRVGPGSTGFAASMREALGACLSLPGILIALCLPFYAIFLCGAKVSGMPSIPEMWLFVFGGLPWGTPTVDPMLLAIWMLLLAAPAIGLSRMCGAVCWHHTERLSFPRLSAWIAASLLFTLLSVIIMWVGTGLYSVLSGVRIGGLFLPDSPHNIGEIGVVLLTFASFILQTMITAIVFVAAYMFSGSEETSLVIAVLPSFWMLLFGSNEDIPRNIFLPANWGMVLRSDLFSASFIDEIVGDGLTKRYDLCAFDPYWALRMQLFLLLAITVILFAGNALRNCARVRRRRCRSA